MRLMKSQLRSAIIARAAVIEGGSDTHGYLACVRGNEAGITSYAHNSADGTGSSLAIGFVALVSGADSPLSFDWTGTVDGLVAMATRGADLAMPDRIADPEDADYVYLCTVYAQILDWDRRGRPGATPVQPDELIIRRRDLDDYTIGAGGAETDPGEPDTGPLGYRAVHHNGVCGIVMVQRVGEDGDTAPLRAVRCADSSPDAIVAFDWVGEVDALVHKAQIGEDPQCTGRMSVPRDYLYEQLREMYNQVLRWNEDRLARRLPPQPIKPPRTFTATVTVTFPYETTADSPATFARNLEDAMRGRECGIPPFVSLAITGAAEVPIVLEA